MNELKNLTKRLCKVNFSKTIVDIIEQDFLEKEVGDLITNWKTLPSRPGTGTRYEISFGSPRNQTTF